MADSASAARKGGPSSATSNTAARVGLPRRRFFHDMPDKGLFALVAVAGFVLILWLKLHGYNPDVVAALGVTLMLAYGAIAYQIPEVHLRLDRLGDNFYYLGFIYTLASMSAALMQLRGGVELEPILGSFGIALITTIAGVAGRVMFVQMRGEIDEVEEQVRRDLLATSNSLKAQLSLALREFETFSSAVRQSANETATRSAAAAEEQIEIVSKIARTASGEIKASFDANRSSAQELTQMVQTVSRTVQKTHDQIASVELPTRRLEQQLDAFGLRLQEVLEKIALAVDDARSIKRRRRRWFWPFRR